MRGFFFFHRIDFKSNKCENVWSDVLFLIGFFQLKLETWRLEAEANMYKHPYTKTESLSSRTPNEMDVYFFDTPAIMPGLQTSNKSMIQAEAETSQTRPNFAYKKALPVLDSDHPDFSNVLLKIRQDPDGQTK